MGWCSGQRNNRSNHSDSAAVVGQPLPRRCIAEFIFCCIQELKGTQGVICATRSAKWSISSEVFSTGDAAMSTSRQVKNSQCIKSRVFIDEWAKEPPQLNCTLTGYHLAKRNARRKNYGPPVHVSLCLPRINICTSCNPRSWIYEMQWNAC